MRLKSLSLKGFKSFADETEINFNENLIGIVGPNGSGKSNIVDAIRWVLGEQKTSELRLDTMADVLFSGTEDRKAGRVAKVTLTFDNTKHILPVEFSEVSISRLLYRDGTSEYRLNKVPCRKKDITSLFMDSGIGSNSYAIISLHMVEDILTDNGQSRRRMLEQAAGISKYKVRKKETLSKLRSTSEDLDRVEDLLFEIKKNMKAFERQARRTLQFNKLRLSYKDFSLAIAQKEYLSKNENKNQLQVQFKSAQDERLSLDTQLNQLEAKVQAAKKDILGHERSLNSDQQAFNKCMEVLSQLENEKNLITQKMDSGQIRLEKIALMLHSHKSQTSDLNQQIKSVQSTVTEVNKQYESSNQQLQEALKAASNASIAYAELRMLEKEQQRDVKEQESKIAENSRLIQHTRAKLQLYETDMANHREDLSAIELKISQIASQINDLQMQIATNNDRGGQMLKKVDKSKQEVEDKQSEIADLQSKYSHEEVALGASRERLKFFRDIVKKQEGIPEAIKFLRKEKQTQAPVLADLIEVKDKKNTPVIEMYLAPYFNAMVVSNEEEAIRLLQIVRTAQKGKLRFLLKDNSNLPAPQKHTHQLKPLIDCLKYDTIHESIIRSCCREVYISDVPYQEFDFEEVKSECYILFPDDFMVWTNHEIYGGSDTLFHGVHLGRKQMIETLESQIKRQEKDLAKFQSEIESGQKAHEVVQDRLDRDSKEYQIIMGAAEGLNQKHFELKSLSELQENRRDQLSRQIADKSSAVEEAGVFLKQQEELSMQLSKNTGKEIPQEDLSVKIEAAYNILQTTNATKEEAQKTYYNFKNELEIHQKELQHQTDRLKNLEGNQTNLGNEQADLEKSIQSMSGQLKHTLEKLKEQSIIKEDMRKKLSQYEDTYYKQKGEIYEWEKELSELRRKTASKDAKLTEIKDQIASVSFDMKGILDRLQIEFGGIADIESYDHDLEGNAAEWKSQRNKIRDKIERFGEINPMAISAYEEIKERHEYISKEKDDILQAKLSLEETIKEIEETAANNFTEAVDAVRVNFKNVFQGLFSNDDDCDIVILNPDDPLESNIEIIAKPKGKRPKSINLLSGGEKALTAASFLFALYLLKPAPFCIFDEVDAPLDDVNVQKFNQLVRRFSNDSQFIIITHNKLTMSEVDVLYGVFLKEKGVSGVSAVDFRSYESAEILTSPEAEIVN